jgi:hypothetical protein
MRRAKIPETPKSPGEQNGRYRKRLHSESRGYFAIVLREGADDSVHGKDTGFNSTPTDITSDAYRKHRGHATRLVERDRHGVAVVVSIGRDEGSLSGLG